MTDVASHNNNTIERQYNMEKAIALIVTLMKSFQSVTQNLRDAWKVAQEAGATKADVSRNLVKAGVYKNANTAKAAFIRALRKDKPSAKPEAPDYMKRLEAAITGLLKEGGDAPFIRTSVEATIKVAVAKLAKKA